MNLYKLFLIVILLMASHFVRAETNIEPEGKDDSIHFLTLADIHFDPFFSCQAAPCPLISKLKQSPATAWGKFFAVDDTKLPQYRKDSNYQLLQSALNAAQKAAIQEKAQFVIVLGDFLGHNFRRLYIKYTGDKSFPGYQVFVKKTLAFINQEIALSFPNLDVYAVVGNNDSYQENYHMQPNGPFFKDVAPLWSSLIKSPQNRLRMEQQFLVNGNYTIDISGQPKLKLIVLNTTLFSRYGREKTLDAAANQTLSWLHDELQSLQANGQKALIVFHIPLSLDVYITQRIRLVKLLTLWQANYAKQFEVELEEFSPQIDAILAGHLHLNWFHIKTLPNGKEIPMTGTPAISPIFFTDPGFKIYSYSPQTQKLNDFAIYRYSMEADQTWRKENDENTF